MSFSLDLKATIRLINVPLKSLPTISTMVLMYIHAQIDMQKAFDRVDLLKLFQQSSKRPIRIHIVFFLFHLYFSVNLYVSWNGVYSSHFFIYKWCQTRGNSIAIFVYAYLLTI